MAEKAKNPIPADMYSITPQLFFNGNCKEAIEFYKKAFNAEQRGEIVPSPDGKTVWHCLMHIGNSPVMLNDTMPQSYESGPKGTTSVGMFLYVDDCDATFDQAVKAGATVEMPMADMFWGDRVGKLKDPFGHSWDIASHKWIYTPEEMDENMKKMMEDQPGG